MRYEAFPGRVKILLTRSNVEEMLKQLNTPGSPHTMVVNCMEGIMQVVVSEDAPSSLLNKAKQGGVEL